MKRELLGRIADEVTAEWVVALHRVDTWHVVSVNDNLRLIDLRRWMGTHLLHGLRPRSSAAGQLLGLIERAMCSPRCEVRLEACDKTGREYRWAWKELLIQLSEESYVKLYS